MTVHAEIHGLEETQGKLKQTGDDLHGSPMEDGMRQATMLLMRGVKQNFVGYESPTVGGVDTGRTRASVTPEVRTHGKVVQGVVGSNLISAAVQETGSKPHWAPLEVFEVWARRHGTTAYVVARAIARRGNIARKQFSRALNDNADKIKQILNDTIGKIVAK